MTATMMTIEAGDRTLADAKKRLPEAPAAAA
jgi:hypothetical protein